MVYLVATFGEAYQPQIALTTTVTSNSAFSLLSHQVTAYSVYLWDCDQVYVNSKDKIVSYEP